MAVCPYLGTMASALPPDPRPSLRNACYASSTPSEPYDLVPLGVQGHYCCVPNGMTACHIYQQAMALQKPFPLYSTMPQAGASNRRPWWRFWERGPDRRTAGGRAPGLNDAAETP